MLRVTAAIVERTVAIQIQKHLLTISVPITTSTSYIMIIHRLVKNCKKINTNKEQQLSNNLRYQRKGCSRDVIDEHRFDGTDQEKQGTKVEA